MMRPRNFCNCCKKPAPCAVYLEGRFEHGTARGYNHGCGCDDCRRAYSEYRGHGSTRGTSPKDDGIVDEVVVERMVEAYPARIWDSIGATRRERLAAAEELDRIGQRVRRWQRSIGVSDEFIDAPSRNGIDKALGLCAGRDYARRNLEQVAS